MRCVRTSAVFFVIMLFLMPFCLFANTLRLATGSPYELGLVDALFAEFKKEVSCELNVTKAGSSESLQMLKSGTVDVHAPAEETKGVEEGWALNRTYIGGNNFVILGPMADPAKIKGTTDAKAALKKIALAQAPSISRGDDSGTHKKELNIWEKAGIKPQ